MTSFKTFLTESASAQLSFASWTMATLLDAYQNAGYDLEPSDRKTFKALKFAAKSGKKPYFWVLCENDGSDDYEYYITKLFLEFTHDGKIGAEPQGMPSEEGTFAEMKAKFAKL